MSNPNKVFLPPSLGPLDYVQPVVVIAGGAVAATILLIIILALVVTVHQHRK